jgi:hypothetical protein
VDQAETRSSTEIPVPVVFGVIGLLVGWLAFGSGGWGFLIGFAFGIVLLFVIGYAEVRTGVRIASKVTDSLTKVDQGPDDVRGSIERQDLARLRAAMESVHRKRAGYLKEQIELLRRELEIEEKLGGANER